MRIAIDVSQVVYKGTGVASYTEKLVRNLLEADRKSEYLLFGASLRQKRTLEDFLQDIVGQHKNATYKIITIPQTIGNILWNKFHVLPIDAFLGKIDIFHSSDWIQPPAKAKKITTIHDLVIYKFPQYSHPQIIETQKRRLYWVKKECDMVVVDSKSTKKDVEEMLKIDSSKIEVVYPGIGEEFCFRDKIEIDRVKRKYGISGDYFLTVGKMEPRKNIRNTVTAFYRFLSHSLIGSRKRPMELVLVGNFGWGEKLDQKEHVRSLGYVDSADLPALYSGASMFLYLSLYEGFGFPVLEAMSCRCPVVTSDRGSLKELVFDSALLADPQIPEDISIKMVRLFIDEDLRKALVEKGEKQAARFKWANTAQKMLEVYKKLIQSKA